MRGLNCWCKNIVRNYGWTDAIKKLLPKQTKYIYNLGVKFERSDVVSSRHMVNKNKKQTFTKK